MTRVVRAAAPDARPAIREVDKGAFGRALEADIVQALNDAGDERVSLVATENGVVVGHVVLSAGSLEDTLVLCLGPIGVRPDRQRGGIGTALMKAALAEAAASDAGLVVLLGHPSYYPRFGFEPADALGLQSRWDAGAAWMALRLPRHDVSAGHGAVPGGVRRRYLPRGHSAAGRRVRRDDAG